MKEHQKNWLQRNLRRGANITAAVVIAALVGLLMAAFLFESNLYPAAWLRSRLRQEPLPAVDASASAQWSGEWDQVPNFWAAWDDGDGKLQALPEDYKRMPIPRVAGEYVYIGGTLTFRGLDVVVETPNVTRADLVAEYWDGRGWVGSGTDGTRRKWVALDHSGKVRSGERDWKVDTLLWEDRAAEESKAAEGYWLRFSVTADLSEDLEASASIASNAPSLLLSGWDLRFHRWTACENRQRAGRSGKTISVTVLDSDGDPVQGVKVGFDTEPSSGIVYDHPDFWGLTDASGSVAWDHLGIPTTYGVWLNDVHVVSNVLTSFGYAYCGTGPGSWRSTIRPGLVSWTLELQQQ